MYFVIKVSDWAGAVFFTYHFASTKIKKQALLLKPVV